MGEWWVNLKGDDLALAYLETIFTSSSCCIRKSEGGYFATADSLNKLQDAREVWEAANTMLQPLSGLAKLRGLSRTPFEVGNVQRLDDDGKTHYNLLTESGLYATDGNVVVVRISEGQTVDSAAPKDPLPELLSLSISDEKVAKALTMYNNVIQVWKDLYPIFEIIQSDVGGAMVSNGWTSKNQIERFARTANHPESAGVHARHGASRHEPPSDPMTEQEGRTFVRSLLTRWLEFKLNPPAFKS